MAFGNNWITKTGTHIKGKSDVKTGRLARRLKSYLLATGSKSVLVSKNV